MNSASVCHDIAGVPFLYVDAFKGPYLKKTTDGNNAFILTHYHGDHYGSLPRDGRYQGPALVHCTPVTGALLRAVHKVPARFVKEHEYGQTWCYPIQNGNNDDNTQAKITFYDANHCPGAAIITIELPDGNVHVHTGDMRYHPKMQSYPILSEAVRNRKLDLLYLDTTYGHPKHDFVAQEVAVDTIASQIHQIFSAHGHVGCPAISTAADRNINSGSTANLCSAPKVLILLSCYSIGKEKVLWEVSKRTNQLVYVSERKLEMMRCIQSGSSSRQKKDAASLDQDDDVLPCSQMIERCTRDPNGTDLHVIPMGLAGELWPYFRPNYRKCADYAEDLVHSYDKVVAFIPTGWANASNWNKKNAVSRKQLECQKSKRFIDVEIRLISYSEHSTCSELISFVEFCRPRKVIPTVFGDENDRQRLEKLFRRYIDNSRAKHAFFKGMQRQSLSTTKHIPTGTGSQKGEPKSAPKQDPAVAAARNPENKSNSAPKQNPAVAAAPNPENKSDGAECIDLTSFSSDDEENGRQSCPSKQTSDNSQVNNNKTVFPVKSVKASATRHSLYANHLPAKRSRAGNAKKTSTQPITNFFSIKKSR